MAYTTINKSTDYFNTVQWTGDATSSRNITGVGFQPDWTWIKCRDENYDHNIFDAVRGANKYILTNSNAIETTATNRLNSWNADGFNIGNATNVNKGSPARNYIAWNWKANGAGSTNYDGSITSTVSANTTAGFSIVSWVGNNTNGATVGHGLNSPPSLVIFKNRSSSNSWHVYHKSLSTPQTSLLLLDYPNGTFTNDNYMSGTVPSSSLLYLGNTSATNESGSNMIAYCFAEKKGYSKFGSYTGNGSTDGTFVYTGFKPAFLIAKRINAASSWGMWDSKRDPINQMSKALFPNLSNAEGTDYYVDFLSNGFKWRLSGSGENGSGSNYIYMAFGQSLVGSNNVPCTAR